MEMHNLNIRLIEHKNFLWTCTTLNDPTDIYDEIASARIQSGIVQKCALIMEENLWLKWISNSASQRRFTLNSKKEFLDRGVMGVWYAGHATDEVVVLTDMNVHKDDRIISFMSYAFMHTSQIKYPRQYDAPVRKV